MGVPEAVAIQPGRLRPIALKFAETATARNQPCDAHARRGRLRLLDEATLAAKRSLVPAPSANIGS